MTRVARCDFHTTKPLGALSQSVWAGAATRYERCKNPARYTLLIADPTLGDPDRVRRVETCSLHKRLYETRGWLP